jgi:hypothetical protein
MSEPFYEDPIPGYHRDEPEPTYIPVQQQWRVNWFALAIIFGTILALATILPVIIFLWRWAL